MATTSSNFDFLAAHDAIFLQLATAAERAFVADPATTVLKLRQLGEAFAKHAASACGLYTGPDATQLDLLRTLQASNIVEGKTKDLFHQLRRAGNRTAHEFTADHRIALDQLRMARQLAIWFHRTFGGAAGRQFRPGLFVPPEDPNAKLLEVEAEVHRLRAALTQEREKAAIQAQLAEAEASERRAAEEAAKQAEAERAEWEKLAATFDAELQAAQAHFETVVVQQQHEVETTGDLKPTITEKVAAASADATAAIELSEADTRLLIDDQLRLAGWEVDTELLRWSNGTRPQKGRNMAIAEWKTGSGPADYVLFVGLTPVAIVEAKKKNKNVSGSLAQAKRYSRAYVFEPGQQIAAGALKYTSPAHGHSLAKDATPDSVEPPFGWYAMEDQGKLLTYKVPFLFSANGREYHRQFEEESGIWFLDARRRTNHARALIDWYTPEGILRLLEQDEQASDGKLSEEPTEYLGLRDYQLAAIRAAEKAIADGKRQALLAMATGTGKTRTTIGLIYRLLKSGRFRRVLFLVDRSALGDQAQNAFKDMRLEANQTFNNIFEVKELGDIKPDPSTRVHVATVQGMVKRALWPSDDDERVPVDRYDLIIVDESHRGYNLDREMTEGEVEVRSLADYVSTYRRVLDHFDAVKIGLTATPALHTRDIFGNPVFTYSYREAVVDGWLIDHEPPIRLMTKLAEKGIHFDKGDEVPVISRGGVEQLALLPDELDFEVADFNKKVIALNFTRVVSEVLAGYLDPNRPEKTLIFCVTDAHADRVVVALNKALVAEWGEIEDNAVLKITGATDKYMEQIRRFRNEKHPSIAVTVDLLTTGIDVPAISNLVFLRRVRSRILYEQMLGRATRLCPEINKEVFRIFDCVDIYKALEDVTEMKPVVTSLNVGFETLVQELVNEKSHQASGSKEGRTHADDVLEQIVARLRRSARRLEGLKKIPDQLADVLAGLEALTGHDLDGLASALKEMDAGAAAAFFKGRAQLAELILQTFERMRGAGDGAFLAAHTDDLVEVAHGYGDAKKPEDYLEAFGKYVAENKNKVAALSVVLARPRDLTRAQLKELRLELASHGYTEAALRTAWRDTTNADIAASIIGFIRQRALGSALVPYETRVERALQKVLGMQAWTPGQKNWLQRIAKQLKVEVIVDHEAFETGAFKSKGGYKALDKTLDGKLDQVLDAFGDAIWKDEDVA